jgi:hypothetical protein
MKFLLIISIIVHCVSAFVHYIRPPVHYRDDNIKVITWLECYEPIVHIPMRFEYERGRTSLVVFQIDYPEMRKKIVYPEKIKKTKDKK